MEEQLALLWELQCLEKQRAALQRLKEPRDATVRALEREIAALQRDIADKRQQILLRRQEYAQTEQLYKEDLARYRQLEKRLYGETIKSRELTSLKGRCDDARTAANQREERLLDLLTQLDTLEEDASNQVARLAEKKASAAAYHRAVAAEAEARQQELARLDAQCTALAARIDAGLLSWYRRTCSVLPQPVARVRAGTCGGCCVALPQRQLAGPHKGLVYCENCGRLLLFS